MILCCGEALIDMIPFPTEAGRDGFVPFPGGAVFNTAIALGRLGVPAGLLTGLSTDLFGQTIRTALKESGVDAAPSVVSDRPTTLAFVQLVDGQAQYQFFDENTAGRMLEPSEMPAQVDARAVFFGGINLAIEPCAEAYAALLLRSARGRVVMIDPNIRPRFIRDEARYRARLERMIALADIVKLSDEDIGWLIPQGTLGEKVAALHAAGPSLVIITRGAEGATAWMKDGRQVTVPARKVAVADTIGAGDTFNAGVLASLDRAGVLEKGRIARLPSAVVEEALALGVRAAAVTVSRSGANPPWDRELPD